MKRLPNIFLLVAMFGGMFGLLPPFPAAVTRYVSDWRVVEPNTASTFDHGLGVMPAEVSATAGPVNPAAAEPVSAWPYQEFGILELEITSRAITVSNYGTEALVVRVVARP